MHLEGRLEKGKRRQGQEDSGGVCVCGCLCVCVCVCVDLMDEASPV